MEIAKILDYESLRQQGIAWLEKLAGSEWTDFNAHDPGITILEQLCYALTDLSYRINFDLEDLLSKEGENTYESLFLPKQILVAQPVTMLDLRKLIIDIDGVKNAWFEPISEPQPSVFYSENPAFEDDTKTIGLTCAEGAVTVYLRGLYRVLIEKSAVLDRGGNDIIQDVSERLHAHRSLAIDFESIQIIDSQPVQLQTSIEITPDADPEEVYLSLLDKLINHVSPSVRFYTLEECLSQGKAIDEIYEGPLLDHGFIDNQELSRLNRKKNLYASDFIREIMAIPGVRMVEFVAMKDGDKLNDTAITIDPNKSPKLDVYNSRFILKKRQLPLQLDTVALSDRFFKSRQHGLPPSADTGLALPQGRDRHIARYYSILQQFPRAYGIGETGLPSHASGQRKAQAKQLKAYLLFFEQFLANSCIQLAHVRDLFSFNEEQPDGYFAASLDDENISELWVEQDKDIRQQRIKSLFSSNYTGLIEGQSTTDWQRKNRFLDHLLARFAEHVHDYSHFAANTGKTGINDIPANKSRLIANKLSLLRNYCQISSRRGSGFNVLADQVDDNDPGLEQVLKIKLGVLDTEKLVVIEHTLLRPIAGDSLQNAPLLINSRSQDPYSLQLTVVFYSVRTLEFKPFVQQTLRDETPAHLIPYLYWKELKTAADFKEAADFDAAYQDWQKKLRAYRALELNNQPILNRPTESIAIPLRAARDRIIDWINIGQTYPIRNLSVTENTMVAFNIQAKIVISDSQPGVSYSLCDSRQNSLDPVISQEGNGGEIELLTPPIVENRIFSIQATKISNGLKHFLLQNTTVLVGLDLGLVATIQNASVLSGRTNPLADDDRIIDFGVPVTVAVNNAQEGVDYQLVSADGKTKLSDAVRGNNNTILLVTTKGAAEDMEIRIRATKTFDKSENKKTETDLLTTILPLKVRANPALTVSMLNPVIDYSGAATVKIDDIQPNISYQAFVRIIADKEFIHGTPTGDVVSLSIGDKQTVTLSKPAADGFIEASTPSQGKSGALKLNLSNTFTEDSFVRIRAVKTHQAKNGELVASTVDLAQVTAVLVRPDPNSGLKLIANVKDSVLLAPIQASGGQAGVFYELTTTADNKIQGLPIYFHQRDRDQDTFNKGIGQLQVEVDLAIAPSISVDALTVTPNFANLPPKLPELSPDVTLRKDAELSIRAIKAQSGVDVVIKRKVTDIVTEPK